MLTRGAGHSNPYKPGAFDPAEMMVAPLAMLGLVLGKKKKRGKWDNLIVLLIVCVVVGMSVSACASGGGNIAYVPTDSPTPTSTPSVPSTSSANQNNSSGGQTSPAKYGLAVVPVNSPSINCTGFTTKEKIKKWVTRIGGQYNPIYWNNMTEQQLGEVQRNQAVRNDCAIFAIAAAFNLFEGKGNYYVGSTMIYGDKYSGSKMAQEID